MEEDIKLLKKITNCFITKEMAQAIENLINKYKEQEKIIELMAVDLMVCVNDFIRFGMFTGNFKKDKELVIEYYEKKARDENE